MQQGEPLPPTTQEPSGSRWPLRPRLTLLLTGALLIAVAVLVAFFRGQSTVADTLAPLIGLSNPTATAPPSLRLLVFNQNGRWDFREPGKSQDEPDVRAQIATAHLAAAEYTISAEPPKRSGLWAPTQIELSIHLERATPDGATAVAGETAEGALSALEDELQARRAWKVLAPALKEADPSATDVRLSTTLSVRKGYLHNGAVAVLVLLLMLSLAPKANDLHRMYDLGAAQMKRFGSTAVLGLVWTGSPAILGLALLYFLGDIAEFLRQNTTLGWFGYVAVFIVSAGIGFLPTYGQSLLGGWVFGFAVGFPGAMLGFVGGSVIGYFIAQRVSKDKVTAALEENPKAAKVRRALIGRGFWKTCGIVALVRLPPNSPFALTNLLLASSGVGLGPYIIGTAIGMAPRTAIAVWLAARAASTGARDIQDFFESQPWWAIPAGVGAFVVVLAIIGWIGNRALQEVTRET